MQSNPMQIGKVRLIDTHSETYLIEESTPHTVIEVVRLILKLVNAISNLNSTLD